MNKPSFSIAAVERDTGLSKDVLRVWERRYGFPVPERDEHGERLYPAEQVERLRVIKRLMDQGHRPGKLIAMPSDELLALAPRRARPAPTVKGMDGVDDDLDELLGFIRRHDANEFVQALQLRLSRLGLQSFVEDVIAPLTWRVGEAWEGGKLEVFEEHLFTELAKRVLRQAIVALPAGTQSPRVLLTSVPEEQHVLGLLMVEALLALEGAQCIPLGTEMPLLEISRAAQAHGADVVALSFSAAFPQRRIPGLLAQLRGLLAAEVTLWVGGSGVSRVTPPQGVHCFASLQQGVRAVSQWRREHAGE